MTEKTRPPPAPRSTLTPTPPLFGEFDRVAGEIGQDLPQALLVADHARRRARGDRRRDLEPFALRARREQFDDAFDELAEIERRDGELRPPRLDLGKIEDVVDQAHQRDAGASDGFEEALLLAIERRLVENVDDAQNAAERRAQLVAHRRQGFGLALHRRFGALHGVAVLAKALHFLLQPDQFGGFSRCADAAAFLDVGEQGHRQRDEQRAAQRESENGGRVERTGKHEGQPSPRKRGARLCAGQG